MLSRPHHRWSPVGWLGTSGLARQLALVVMAALAYFGVRGVTQSGMARAFAHAHQVIEAEQWLGIDWEVTLQQLIIDHASLVTMANWIYIYGHWPVVACVLTWLFVRHRDEYLTLRDAMFISGAIGLIIFIAFPTAPPRFIDMGLLDTVTDRSESYRTLQPPGLVLDCYLPREDVRDAFVSLNVERLADLPQGATVGSSSLRRRAQLAHRRPDLRLVEFRGNVQTRLKKLDEGVASATFLAMAGLNRLGLAHIARSPIEPEEMLPAVAQGAIGIERRADDDRAAALLAAIHHGETGDRLAAERAFLAALDGSCQTPIAGLAVLGEGGLWLRGEILSPDGSVAVRGERRVAVADGAGAGRDLARDLLSRAPAGFRIGH